MAGRFSGRLGAIFSVDLEKVKELQRTLTLHFAILAVLTAMLVATGSNSVFLPVFICLVATFAYIFVDKFEWIELGRIGSYFGMTAATATAVVSYVYSVINESESGQLMAVSGLLVYPEAVLFLQRKNLRIFEQLAVFLLLEMIVAALVNDNLLFGVLLTPIILLWVSSLFLFSRYASLVYVDPTIEKPMPKLAEILFQRFIKTVLGDQKKAPAVTSQLVVTSEVQNSRTLRRAMQSIPVGIGALTFAGLFFYLLPRTSPGDLDTGIRNDRGIGLPTTLTFGAVGKILQQRTPVMRVSIKQPLSDEPYKIESPPYLRSMVFDNYAVNRRRGWLSRGEWRLGNSMRFSRLRKDMGQDRWADYGRDQVRVEFDIKKRFISSMFAVPPVYRTDAETTLELKYDPFYMMVQRLNESSDVPKGKSLVYELGSAGFAGGRQVPITPAQINSIARDRQMENTVSESISDLIDGFNYGFEKTRSYTQRVLADAGIPTSDVVRVAQEIERHFVYSGVFTYSLDLRPPDDPSEDAIEDFIVNSRSGHCQYFASAMVAMLRQQEIPCRIVVGYHPKEFNEIGDYFLVRQSDAHAWVEVLFHRADLLGTEYEQWLADSDYYWVHFDPTPSSTGEEAEIVAQQGQAMDYAEKLWKDYVVEGQKLSGENGIYAPVTDTEDAYAGMVDSWNRLRDRLRQGQFFDIRGLGFQWQVTIAVVLVGVCALVLWQVIVFLPSLLSELGKRVGIVKSRLAMRYAFFERCLRLLEQFSGPRQESETPLEFTQDATEVLSARGQAVDGSLRYLTNLYYRLRFGVDQATTPAEFESIDHELRKIEEAVAAARRKK